MRLAIIGSRTFNRYDFFALTLGTARPSLIVSGGARGADRFAEVWAKENGIEMLVFPADWQKHGRRAGILRNYDIIDNADRVLAFWDGKSTGTNHSIEYAQSKGKRVMVVTGWTPLEKFDWSWDNPLFDKIKPQIPPCPQFE